MICSLWRKSSWCKRIVWPLCTRLSVYRRQNRRDWLLLSIPRCTFRISFWSEQRRPYRSDVSCAISDWCPDICSSDVSWSSSMHNWQIPLSMRNLRSSLHLWSSTRYSVSWPSFCRIFFVLSVFLFYGPAHDKILIDIHLIKSER